ncbi:FAD-binding protein [Gracilibacillus caseinilyticus]|uniref:FAD-binding protein n=1 Tax=Gracilibacillus caseinilyticus TaxID=2932256 RepID=UPI00350F3635
MIDCAVIGGGPAGLNASLVLARAKQQTIVFDDNQARNAVTHASHGFITRDGNRMYQWKTGSQWKTKTNSN